MLLEHILSFKENYAFRVKALSLPHTEDEGEPKFRKKLTLKYSVDLLDFVVCCDWIKLPGCCLYPVLAK